MTPTLTFNRVPLTPMRVTDLGLILVLYYPAETPLPTSSKTWRDELAAAGYTLITYGRVLRQKMMPPFEDGYVEVRARKVE